MTSAAYLGIDIGTSGIRGSCIDESCDELVSLKIPFEHTPITSNDTSEQDPLPWLEMLDRLLEQITAALTAHDATYRIRGIAIDGTSSTLIACKKDGTALSPAMMYNDQQSKEQANIIKRFAPADSAVHGASSSLAKALFLLKRYSSTEKLCHQADWLAASLTGKYGVSDENNCLKLGYDSITGCWPEWLFDNPEDAVIPASLLPEVYPPGTSLSTIKSELIKKYGLDENCILVAGTTDSNAAVLATGAYRAGDAVTSLGSTLVVKLFSDKPIFDP